MENPECRICGRNHDIFFKCDPRDLREPATPQPSAGLDGSTADCLNEAQNALNRLRRAHRRGTGCHLTAEMISSLALTLIGQIWDEDDPR